MPSPGFFPWFGELSLAPRSEEAVRRLMSQQHPLMEGLQIDHPKALSQRLAEHSLH